MSEEQSRAIHSEPPSDEERNVNTPVEIIELDSWDDFESRLREFLKQKLGFAFRVIIRRFDRDRVPIVRKNGGDRDKSSRVWEGYSQDVQHHPRHNIDPSLIMYAVTVGLDYEPALKLPLGHSIGPLSKQYDDDSSLLSTWIKSSGEGVFEKDVAFAVYSPEFIDRVSQNEYHFQDQDSKKKSLLAIFVVKK